MLKSSAAWIIKLITIIAEVAGIFAKLENIADRVNAVPSALVPDQIHAMGCGETNWSTLSEILSSFCSVDLQSDINNCGICAYTCADGQSCVQGKCTCPSSKPSFCDEEW